MVERARSTESGSSRLSSVTPTSRRSPRPPRGNLLGQFTLHPRRVGGGGAGFIWAALCASWCLLASARCWDVFAATRQNELASKSLARTRRVSAPRQYLAASRRPSVVATHRPILNRGFLQLAARPASRCRRRRPRRVRCSHSPVITRKSLRFTVTSTFSPPTCSCGEHRASARRCRGSPQSPSSLERQVRLDLTAPRLTSGCCVRTRVTFEARSPKLGDVLWDESRVQGESESSLCDPTLWVGTRS